MGDSAPPHIGCGAFNARPLEDLPDGVVHRFLVGEDAAPVRLSTEEARATLGDRFAELLLLEGRFPSTAAEVIDELQATAGDDSLAPRFFVLGEGSLLPPDVDAARPMRFVVALGGGSEGPAVVISSFAPHEPEVELMAWDTRWGGFNFYRTVGPTGVWVFAGNSRHALGGKTEGNGPFESHRSGSFLMKELRAPWINWDSPDAAIDPAVLPAGSREWFERRDPGGALTCERQVARPMISRWARARFDELAEAGIVEDPRRVMSQILQSPAVNLVSSFKKPHEDDGEPIDLPPTFFVDQGLADIVSLPIPTPTFTVKRTTYAASLTRFEVNVTDGRGFERSGDTFFAFVVPERAAEDEEVLRHALRIGLITRRLAACLLMTDFPNPVFSGRRAKLLDHVPDGPVTLDAQPSFSQQVADAILAAVGQDEDAPEAEFKRLWDIGEDFEDDFAARVVAYHDAVAKKLEAQAGMDAIYELAESRRGSVKEMPIAEFPLLFSVSNIEPLPRVMKPDGSVVQLS